MTVLVDTNVLLDVFTDDSEWKHWSLSRLNGLALSEKLAINDVIFAELAPAFDAFEGLNWAIDHMGLKVLPFDGAALYLAGRVHHRYRREKSGTKDGVLPDFFIGAQAAVESLTLLTRDARRFRTYFPTVELITP